jgi:protein SCO1/2
LLPEVVAKNGVAIISKKHKAGLTTVLLLVAVCLLMLYFFTSERFGRSGATFLVDRVASMVLPPRPIVEFELIDGEERPFTIKNLTNKWTFIVFGFTYCPDICPTTLSVMTEFREALLRDRTDAKDVNFILITVDPERDTPAVLKQYVQHFDRHFLGLSGSDLQIRNLANQLAAPYEITKKDASGSYSVSHSASLYLIDPHARHYATYLVPLDAALISQRFSVFKQLYAGMKDTR